MTGLPPRRIVQKFKKIVNEINEVEKELNRIQKYIAREEKYIEKMKRKELKPYQEIFLLLQNSNIINLLRDVALKLEKGEIAFKRTRKEMTIAMRDLGEDENKEKAEEILDSWDIYKYQGKTLKIKAEDLLRKHKSLNLGGFFDFGKKIQLAYLTLRDMLTIYSNQQKPLSGKMLEIKKAVKEIDEKTTDAMLENLYLLISHLRGDIGLAIEGLSEYIRFIQEIKKYKVNKEDKITDKQKSRIGQINSKIEELEDNYKKMQSQLIRYQQRVNKLCNYDLTVFDKVSI